MYDAYRTDLQTLEEFFPWSKKMESKVEIIPYRPDKPSNLCEILEHVNKNLYPNIYCFLKILLTMPLSTDRTFDNIVHM